MEEKRYEIKIVLNSESIDTVIKKAEKLKSLLGEVNQLIRNLGEPKNLIQSKEIMIKNRFAINF